MVFISIDDGENKNILKLCDEIFGEENFVGNIIWKNVTDNNPTNIATEHEYIVVYAKFKVNLEAVWKSNLSDLKLILVKIGEELNLKFKDQPTLQYEYSKWFRVHKAQLGALDRYKYIDTGGIYTGSQSVHNPGREGYRYDVIHPKTLKPCKPPLLGYRFPEGTMDKLLQDGKILFGDDHNKIIELKVYAKDYLEKLSSVEILDGRLGAYDLRTLFPEFKKTFTNPKPIDLIEKYLSFILMDSDIILDFFAGSATTAHAVMQLNAEDGGSRKFIMVQLPEVCDEKSEAFKAGYKTIAEISKERIRRAGKKILDDMAVKDTPKAKDKETGDLFSESSKDNFSAFRVFRGSNTLDTGFRVLKVDSGNMADVYYTPDAISQDGLFNLTDNIKPDRSEEDLLFQVLLDWGVDLTLPITRETLEDNEVYFVDNNALAACFVKKGRVTESFCKELAKRQPLRVVFRDAGFKDDSVKINVEQIFKLMSPHTDVRII